MYTCMELSLSWWAVRSVGTQFNSVVSWSVLLSAVLHRQGREGSTSGACFLSAAKDTIIMYMIFAAAVYIH
jgi:hypothetical protein